MKKTLLNKSNFTKSILISVLLFFTATSKGAVNAYSTAVQTGVALENIQSNFSLLINSSIDNSASVVSTLPFAFTFNGVSYTQFSVNSNGLLRLGSTVVSTNAVNSLLVNSDFPKISPYWDDLTTNGLGYVASSTTPIGVAPNRKFVVEFKMTVPKASGTSYAVQVWFFETSNILKFVYSGLPINAGNYSVGLSTSTTDFISATTSASTATFNTGTVNDVNTSAITSGLSLTFSPPLSCAVNLAPTASATGVNPGSTTLNWSSGGGPVTGYDVYFGTAANPPLVSTNQTATTYNPGSLADSTVYFWRIAPRNGATILSSCSINGFTTAALLKYNVNRTTNISYTSISGTGTSIPSWKNATNTDDNLSSLIPLTFNFNYAGAAYRNIIISTNGFITLDSTTTANGGTSLQYNYSSSNLYATGASMSPLLIAPFYQDLVCQGNPGSLASLQSSIKYSITGSTGSKVMTIEWINMETYNNLGPDINFQLKLYEGTNKIEFIYGTMEGFDGSSNYLYNYAIGLNGKNISTTARSGEIFAQLTENTRNFGLTSATLTKAIPDCNSMIQFAPGTYQPYVNSNSIPANDNVAGATHLSVNASPCTSYCGTYYSSANATASPVAVGSCGGNADDDVWFEFTATNPNTTIKLIASGNYSPIIELFNSSMTSITCSTGQTGLSATITSTTLTLNSQYFIRVYDANIGSGLSGMFGMCVSATAIPPTNDECTGAINLNVTASITYTTGTQTLAATASSGIPSCSLNTTVPDDDVWYSFFAGNVNEIISVNSGSGFDAVIQLFSGTCGNLTSMQCINTTGSGQVETLTANNLTKNQTYYFRVYHSTVTAGTGNYGVNVSSPIPACPVLSSPANATGNVPVTGITLKWNKSANTNTYKVLLDSLNNPPVQVVAITTDTFYTITSLQAGMNYYWSIKAGNTSGYSSGCNPNVFSTVPLDFALNIKVFLEGLYKGNGKMIACIDPIAHDTLADTITVSLANPTTKVIMYSAKAVLSTNGLASPVFPQPAIGQNYYIVIKNRNHLETWSSQIFGFNTPDTLYTFSDAITKAYGSNQVLVSANLYAIHYGDLNQDGHINFSDFQQIDLKMTQFLSGYITEDINGDRVVESSDYSMIENKINLNINLLKP